MSRYPSTEEYELFTIGMNKLPMIRVYSIAGRTDRTRTLS